MNESGERRQNVRSSNSTTFENHYMPSRPPRHPWSNRFAYDEISQSINENLCSALQDPYSEALSTQAKWKWTVFGSWWNWGQAPFGRCFKSKGSLGII